MLSEKIAITKPYVGICGYWNRLLRIRNMLLRERLPFSDSYTGAKCVSYRGFSTAAE